MKAKRTSSPAKSPLASVYLFYGQEDFLIEQSVQEIVDRALDEAARGFNYDVVDGSKTDVPALIALASAYPMMSERRVVVVQDFEKMALRDADKDALARYFENPLPSTCLILIAPDADMRKKPFTALKQYAESRECKPLRDPKIPEWIEHHIRSKGKGADPGAVVLLHEYVGNSLRALDSEIAERKRQQAKHRVSKPKQTSVQASVQASVQSGVQASVQGDVQDVQNTALYVQNAQQQVEKAKLLDRMLDIYLDSPGIGATEMSEELRVSRSTVYNYLNELEQAGRVRRNGDGVEVIE